MQGKLFVLAAVHYAHRSTAFGPLHSQPLSGNRAPTLAIGRGELCPLVTGAPEVFSHNLAMQELAAQIGPEFLHQIETGIGRQVESQAIDDGMQSLLMSGYIDIAQRLRDGAPDHVGRVESLISFVVARDHHAAH